MKKKDLVLNNSFLFELPYTKVSHSSFYSLPPTELTLFCNICDLNNGQGRRLWNRERFCLADEYG